jgi:hypothetical protein
MQSVNADAEYCKEKAFALGNQTTAYSPTAFAGNRHFKNNQITGGQRLYAERHYTDK